MGFLPLLSLIISGLSTALPLIPSVNKAIATTATDIATGVIGLIGGIIPGKATSSNVIAALSGSMTLLMTLKADTSISPDDLNLINSKIAELQAAIVGYVSGGKGFDADNYNQLAPIA